MGRGTGGAVSPAAAAVRGGVASADRVMVITSPERSASYQALVAQAVPSSNGMPGALTMSQEAVSSTTLAATRRTWNIFALVVLLLAAGAPVAFLAAASWSPRPVRVGTVTLLGPHCKNTGLIIIRSPPAGLGGRVVHDVYSAGSTHELVYSIRPWAGGDPIIHLPMLSPSGAPLPTVTGKHLWRLGPFALVLN